MARNLLSNNCRLFRNLLFRDPLVNYEFTSGFDLNILQSWRDVPPTPYNTVATQSSVLTPDDYYTTAMLLDPPTKLPGGSTIDGVWTSGEYTVCFWLWLPWAVNSAHVLSVMAMNGTNPIGWTIYLDSARPYVNVSNGNGYSLMCRSSNGLPRTNNPWSKICLRVSNSGTNVTLWVNGVMSCTATSDAGVSMAVVVPRDNGIWMGIDVTDPDPNKRCSKGSVDTMCRIQQLRYFFFFFFLSTLLLLFSTFKCLSFYFFSICFSSPFSLL